LNLGRNGRFSQKQNEFIDVFTVVHQVSNRHIQAVMNNLKSIISDYLGSKKSGILDWRKDFCEWFLSIYSIWKVMPSKHLTEYNTLRDNASKSTLINRLTPWCGGVP